LHTCNSSASTASFKIFVPFFTYTNSPPAYCLLCQFSDPLTLRSPG
jgi:hypothetical protein